MGLPPGFRLEDLRNMGPPPDVRPSVALGVACGIAAGYGIHEGLHLDWVDTILGAASTCSFVYFARIIYQCSVTLNVSNVEKNEIRCSDVFDDFAFEIGTIFNDCIRLIHDAELSNGPS
eukprot:g82903.t1